MNQPKSIYCTISTIITCCGENFAVRDECQKLDDHIRRYHVKKQNKKYFKGGITIEKRTPLPINDQDPPIGQRFDYDFQSQGLLCAHCGGGNKNNQYFRPQSLGNHIKASCPIICSHSTRKRNREKYQTKYQLYKQKIQAPQDDVLLSQLALLIENRKTLPVRSSSNHSSSPPENTPPLSPAPYGDLSRHATPAQKHTPGRLTRQQQNSSVCRQVSVRRTFVAGDDPPTLVHGPRGG